MDKYPSLDRCVELLNEAAGMNPGKWIDHCIEAGRSARKIAERINAEREAGDAMPVFDPDRAEALGRMHDIGRRYDVLDMRHIIMGYKFMMELGYEECARICLTHSFPGIKDIRTYSGQNDCTDEETAFIRSFIKGVEYTDYDRLIQLCDAVSAAEGPVYIEKRLMDVAIRRGVNEFTTKKWQAHLDNKGYFDGLCGMDVHRVIGVG